MHLEFLGWEGPLLARAAEWLVQRGVSIYKVSKLLGHSNVRTTEIYAYLAPETFHPEVNLLDYENPRDEVVKKLEKVGEGTT